MAGAKLKHDDLCQDDEVRDAKEKTMAKMKWGPMFNTVSRALGMIGGPIFGTGLMASFGLVKVAPELLPTIITATVIGGIMSLAALGIDYVSSRIYQSCGFDQTEVSAKSYAKSFVKELKSSGIVVSVDHKHDAPCRKDGKSWAQAVAEAQPEVQRIM